MPVCALSFSRSLIDFPVVVVDLTVVLEDELPRDIDHRSSNPDKPLAGVGVAAPEAGALFGAVDADARVRGVDEDPVGESGCDDVQRVLVLLYAGVGDIAAAKDWDCLWLATEETGLIGALKTGGEVVL